MLRFTTYLVFTSCALSGCASGALGNSEYGCKGMPDGVRCLSTLEVYAATEHADAVRETDERGATSQPTTLDASNPPANLLAQGTPADQSMDPAPGMVPGQGTLTPRDFVGLVPTIDAPVPLRMPAQIMRIWFAPWEDASGDLTVSTIVFTEIVSRRWLIGEAYAHEDTTLSPLEPPSTTP